ncbi:unnamed protein product [Cylindrotheca closterium]|uniref:UBA domain-containing protein n=1 Tax=Cylindrotheca closterium TaxID=2856 RepID=A0AAD2G3P9_9STRA|nr:unnamed protein product [Cylindrotheca closterium]
MSSGDISQLTAMGFDEPSSRQALASANGNVETAVNILLGVIPAPAAPSSSSAASPSAADVGDMIVCPTSQYSVDNGRSACTCIALTAATDFLKLSGGGSVALNAEFLQNMIMNGVQNYQTLSSASPVEHLSAEEVLQKDQGKCFPLSVRGGIRQGILSSDSFHPMGMQALLEGIQQEQQGQSNAYIAVLITKTPETVLVCLPVSGSNSAHWLIDSHPRAAHLGADGSYAKPHPNLASLLLSLQAIFPPTELGPDIPEMMAMMYNSFDMYPLQMN